MKMLDKVTEGAGIALNYLVGLGMLWFGSGCSVLTLILWAIFGLGVALSVFGAVFGLLPIGLGVWLFRRGRIQQQLFKVKLLKEAVRKLAFQHDGRLQPAALASAQGYTTDKALNILKNLAAEDPERVELQLDYDSGELYFEFADIRRALAARAEYQALPPSATLGLKAVELSQMVGKTVETFYEYVAYAQNAATDPKKIEKYKQKVTQFVEEIEALKHQ
jgi:hypothetical protein